MQAPCTCDKVTVSVVLQRESDQARSRTIHNHDRSCVWQQSLTLRRRQQNRIELYALVNPKLKYKNCSWGIVLLTQRSSTDRHEASRGLFATAELLVLRVMQELCKLCKFFFWTNNVDAYACIKKIITCDLLSSKDCKLSEKTLINMNQVMFCIFSNKNGNPLLKSEKFFGPKISSNASELGLKAYTKFILKLWYIQLGPFVQNYI